MNTRFSRNPAWLVELLEDDLVNDLCDPGLGTIYGELSSRTHCGRSHRLYPDMVCVMLAGHDGECCKFEDLYDTPTKPDLVVGDMFSRLK